MVLAYNSYNNRYYVFNHKETPYERSLRKLRRKVRFNLAMGTVNFAFFTTLTYDADHFEKVGRKVDASKDVSKFLKALKKHDLPDLQYVWRLEVGSDRYYRDETGRVRQATARIHVHMMCSCNISSWLSEWTYGKSDNEQILDSVAKVGAYLTKYISKETGDEEGFDPDPVVRLKNQELRESKKLNKHLTIDGYDPTMYGARRFGTSQGFLPVPKSRWKIVDASDNDFIGQIRRASVGDASHDGNAQLSMAEARSEYTLYRGLSVKQQNRLIYDWLSSDYESRRGYSFMDWRYWFASISDRDLYFEKREYLDMSRFLRSKTRKDYVGWVSELVERQKTMVFSDYLSRRRWWQKSMVLLKKNCSRYVGVGSVVCSTLN